MHKSNKNTLRAIHTERFTLSKRRQLLAQRIETLCDNPDHAMWSTYFLCGAFNTTELRFLPHQQITEAEQRLA
ncbi:MAG: hypothetical protein R8M45_10275, partial [Ghiorsea sp.]